MALLEKGQHTISEYINTVGMLEKSAVNVGPELCAVEFRSP